jgi:hypothetical protein
VITLLSVTTGSAAVAHAATSIQPAAPNVAVHFIIRPRTRLA